MSMNCFSACTDNGWFEARVVAFDGTVRQILENTAS